MKEISYIKRDLKMMLKEVSKGFECGMQIENYNDIKEGRYYWKFMLWKEIKR